MQVVATIINLVLSVMGLVCIHLVTYKKDKYMSKIIMRILIPGGLLGAGIPFLLEDPISVTNILNGMLLSILFGEALYILYLIIENTLKDEKAFFYYNDGKPPKVYITGDKHRSFGYIEDFCKKMDTNRHDILIILGDAGFNYYGDDRDDKLKKDISKLNITLFCIHGNKENRPQNIGTYGVRSFSGGKVLYEPKYPNIYFAIDGDVYNFDGKKYMVVGGAHSVDKMRCLEEDKPFWDDEMPNESIKTRVEQQLANEENCIYGMLTHTCPIEYLPTEMFMSTQQNAKIKRKPKRSRRKNVSKPDIDRSTEEWLGKLEKQLDYKVWYCGHYHIDKQIDKICMLYKEIRPLNLWKSGEE